MIQYLAGGLLHKNLGETLEGFFLDKKTALKEAVQDKAISTSEETDSPVPWHTGMTKQHEAKSHQQHQERVERYHKIHDLNAKKVDPANIARQVGLSRQSVYYYLHMKQPPERTRIHVGRKPLITPYKDYLIQRWNEGCRSAQQMYREIKEQGYTGSSTNVGRFIAPWRASKGTPRSFKSVDPQQATMIKPDEGKKKHPPTALQVARWMTFTQTQRLDWQNEYLARLSQADPVIAQTFDLVQDFATMLRERQGERLDAWINQAQGQEVVEMRSFAKGLLKDYDAVKAGLTLEWSQGQVEGQVHRLMLLKRQMYGRGSFQVLRKRVLQRA